jgi:hypothetical protein
MGTITRHTHRDVIKDVRDRWQYQYRMWGSDEAVQVTNGPRKIGTIRRALRALDLETCSAEDVDAAIGRPGWVALTCDVCNKDQDEILHIESESERAVDVCFECARTAMK